MKIKLKTITIRDLVNGFKYSDENGVVGYGGRLNIRPPYQREFVYKDKQKKEVIRSIFNNYPLNVMYWICNENNTYELLDGQQRTMSICSYYAGGFFMEINNSLKAFYNLSDEQKEQFLNYTLQIYICKDGSTDEQLKWFQIINIAGEKLTDQELLNAIYSGPWITDAKKHFSKQSCAAFKMGSEYMSGNPIRQDYLETILNWISNNNIKDYMATHQHDNNADREWQYFQKVIAWIKSIFPNYRKIMKGLPWGDMYNRYKDADVSSTDLEDKIQKLLIDDDVTRKKGVYEYVLTGEEKHLSLRTFSDAMKIATYEKQKGICAKCGNSFVIEEMEADHIIPWSKGGHTTPDNCQMLCKNCNRTKSNI